MFSMIAAVGPSGEIGFDGKLPWPKLQQDMDWFVANTAGKNLVVGNRTWQTLPKRSIAKHNRLYYPVSRSFSLEAAHPTYSFNRILELEEKEAQNAEWVVIGGAEIYAAFFPYVSKIYLTRVGLHIEKCDTFLNMKELDHFEVKWEQQSNRHNVNFQILLRK